MDSPKSLDFPYIIEGGVECVTKLLSMDSRFDNVWKNTDNTLHYV